MVKRKATNSPDEWLIEGELASATTQPGSEIAIEPCTTVPSPAAEIIQPQVASDPSVVVPAERAITETKVARWFWSVLAQAGYKCW